jgi:hypothetical protein
VTNLLFRTGAAAILLSNKAEAWRGRAKYKLTTAHRVHVGQSDDAYTCVGGWEGVICDCGGDQWHACQLWLSGRKDGEACNWSRPGFLTLLLMFGWLQCYPLQPG